MLYLVTNDVFDIQGIERHGGVLCAIDLLGYPNGQRLD